MKLFKSNHVIHKHLIVGVLAVVSCYQQPQAMAETSTNNLVGTSWTLISSGNPEGLSEPISGTDITAEFSESQVKGSGGCNIYTATYQTTSDSLLTVDPLAATKRACAPEILQQEFRYFVGLRGAQRYEVNELGQLEIFYQTDTENGVLIFENADT